MIHLEHRGRGDGTPVVLLHGVGLDHTMWSRCLAALDDHDVLLLDLRGHGQSPPAGPDTELTGLVDDVVAVLDRPAHVVGFSLGALVAQRLAATHPELVRSMTLVSAVARRSADERTAVRQRLERAATDFPASVEAAVTRWFSAQWQEREPRLLEQVRDRMLSNDVTSYVNCYRVFAEADVEVALLQELVTAPTLVMTGEHDPGSTPAMAHRLGKAIGSTRAVVVVPDARHLLPLERPDEVTSALLSLINEVENHEHIQNV